MTMQTRCAACGTVFRITTEQLTLRQGKVRCGSCGSVFSALEHLLQNVPENTSGQHEVAAQLTPDLVPGLAAARPVATTIVAPDATSAELVLTRPAIEAAADDPNILAEAAPPAPGIAEQSAEIAPNPAPSGSNPRVKSTRRWLSAIGVALASMTLLFQGVYFYRNEAIAHVPESRPWLERMCSQLACKFDAPRDAQAISIESHDLQADPVNKNLLALVALLRNRASFVQDSPLLELTLTDGQEAALARKVLSPRDYLGAPRIAAGSELQVRILIDAGQLRASGYRLYAFYP